MTGWTLRGLRCAQGSFALGPVDLALGDAETVAVIGRSGAGKTTLLRAIAGLQPLTSGRVEKGEVDRTGWPAERRRLAYVPQGLGLFPHLTARKNVRFAARLRDPSHAEARTDELLRRFGLASFAERRPGELSTGEQQRVAVARAIASDPELLLWDEPLGALDVAAREELLGTLAPVHEVDRIPLVLVTHDPSIAYSLADRFLLLEGGRVRFLGDAAALVERPGDPFVARFLGYENVFTREELAGLKGSPLGRWLFDRAGPSGVAFVTGALRVTGREGAEFRATVRRREPTPAGLRVDLNAGGVGVTALVPYPAGSDPAPSGVLGTEVGVEVDPTRMRPLDGWP